MLSDKKKYKQFTLILAFRSAGRAEYRGRVRLRQAPGSGVVSSNGRGRCRRSRHVPAPGTAPRGRRLRAGADDRVGDGRPDGQDPGAAEASTRARPVVPVSRGCHQ